MLMENDKKETDKNLNEFDILWSNGLDSKFVKRLSFFGDLFYLSLDMTDSSKHDSILSELRSGRAPVLANHDGSDLNSVVGRVKTAWIEDGKGYATIEIDQGRPDLIGKIKTKIINNISPGFEMYQAHKEKTTYKFMGADLSYYRVTDFKVVELSLVPIGADGEARILNEKELNLNANKEDMLTTERLVAAQEQAVLNIGNKGEKMEKEITEDRLVVAQAQAVSNIESKGEKMEKEITADQHEATQLERESKKAEQEAALKFSIDEGKSFAKGIFELAREHGLNDEWAFKQIEKSSSLDDVRKDLLTILANRTMDDIDSGVEVGRDRRDTLNEDIENYYEYRVGLSAELNNSHWENAHMTEPLKELVKDSSSSGFELFKAALSTTTFPNILSNIANKLIVKSYQELIPNFQQLGTRVVLKDFKEAPIVGLSSFPSLTKKSEGTAVTAAETISDRKETVKLTTYASKVKLTNEMIINDDLNSFTRAISAWGMKAIQKESDVVWTDTILGSGNMSDGKSLFHTDRKNTLASTKKALTLDNLDSAYQLMRAQKDSQSSLINLKPAYLVVGSSNFLAATQLVTTLAPVVVGEAVPTHISTLKVIEEVRITDGSWFLFAAPAYIDNFVYAYLASQQRPQVKKEVLLDNDVEFFISHHFGCSMVDFRGIVKAKQS